MTIKLPPWFNIKGLRIFFQGLIRMKEKYSRFDKQDNLSPDNLPNRPYHEKGDHYARSRFHQDVTKISRLSHSYFPQEFTQHINRRDVDWSIRRKMNRIPQDGKR